MLVKYFINFHLKNGQIIICDDQLSDQPKIHRTFLNNRSSCLEEFGNKNLHENFMY